MRCSFPLSAALALFGLLIQNAYSSDADRGSLQDVLDYASGYAEAGDSTRAIVVYDMMIRAFSRTGNSENLSVACDELVANVPPDDIQQLNISFWRCPETLLAAWLGNIDPYRAVDPVLIRNGMPAYPSHTEVDEGYVDVVFDISSEGDIENIRVVASSSSEWQRSVIRVLRRWKFRPALYNGQPVKTSDVRHRFTFALE